MNIDILWSVCNIIIKTGDIRTLCTLQQCCMEMNNYIAQMLKIRKNRMLISQLRDFHEGG
jgi:hypothetical protein